MIDSLSNKLRTDYAASLTQRENKTASSLIPEPIKLSTLQSVTARVFTVPALFGGGRPIGYFADIKVNLPAASQAYATAQQQLSPKIKSTIDVRDDRPVITLPPTPAPAPTPIQVPAPAPAPEHSNRPKKKYKLKHPSHSNASASPATEPPKKENHAASKPAAVPTAESTPAASPQPNSNANNAKHCEVQQPNCNPVHEKRMQAQKLADAIKATFKQPTKGKK